MILTLALRNLQRSLPRLRPMALVLILVFASLFTINSIFYTANTNFSLAFQQHLSADLAISPSAGGDRFTLFGGAALLVGDLQRPPLLSNVQELFLALDQSPAVYQFAGLLTLQARLEGPNYSAFHTVFGVDFTQYAQLFPQITFVTGGFPTPNSPGLLLQEHQYLAMNPPPALGDMVLFTYSDGYSFTLREAPLAGVYRYPVSDPLLETIVLLDASTARSLSGYVVTNLEDAGLSQDQRSLFDTSLDDLFASPELFAPDSPQEASDLWSQTETLLSSQEDRVVQARQTLDGAWHFVLIRYAQSAQRHHILALLEGLSDPSEYLLRDWRSLVGGSVLLVRYLQVLANAGLAFVALGALIITMNALALSVLERAKEWGTLRALGAQKTLVSWLIGTETIVFVLVCTILGILLGFLIIFTINPLNIRPNNLYLTLLFGGQQIRGTFSWILLFIHLGAGLGISLLALVYPLKKLLSINPARVLH